MPLEPTFARYTIGPVTIDGPELPAGEQIAVTLHATVDDEHERAGLPDPMLQPPFTLRVQDWAGPWRAPLNAQPNPLGDAARELRELRAKWAAQGVQITGGSVTGDALIVNYQGHHELVHGTEVRLRLLPPRT